MYGVIWWQLFPETPPKFWTDADTGEPEKFDSFNAAAQRRDELLRDEAYRHLGFDVAALDK